MYESQHFQAWGIEEKNFFNSIVLSYNVNIFFVSIYWANALEQNSYDFKGIFYFVNYNAILGKWLGMYLHIYEEEKERQTGAVMSVLTAHIFMVIP